MQLHLASSDTKMIEINKVEVGGTQVDGNSFGIFDPSVYGIYFPE